MLIIKIKDKPARIFGDLTTLHLQSDDQMVSFHFVATSTGLNVEYSQIRPGRSRVLVSAVFQSDDRLIKWLDASRLRFTYPLLDEQIRRRAIDLFRQSPATFTDATGGISGLLH